MALSSISSAYQNALSGFGALREKIKSEVEASESGSQTQSTKIKAEENPDSKNNIFERLLESNNKAPRSINKETLQEQLNELRKQAKDLLHHPNPDQVRTYVSNTKSFLGDLRDAAYNTNKQNDLFKKLDLVDQDLEKMADTFLEDNQKEFALVNSLGELQGLLIDIFV